MSKQKLIPFAEIEREVLHKYRKNLHLAKSAKDVKEFFNYAVKDFFAQAFAEQIKLEDDDILLIPESKIGFSISSKLRGNPAFRDAQDLASSRKIIGRLAAKGNHLIHNLEGTDPAKIEAKRVEHYYSTKL